jgi:hypothetical protein
MMYGLYRTAIYHEKKRSKNTHLFTIQGSLAGIPTRINQFLLGGLLVLATEWNLLLCEEFDCGFCSTVRPSPTGK